MQYNIIFKNLEKSIEDISNIDEYIEGNYLTIDKIYDENNNVIFNSKQDALRFTNTCKYKYKYKYKYIKTFESFVDEDTIKKYYDVVFKENYTLKNVYNGDEDPIDVNINKGDNVRLFVNIAKTNTNNFVIKGFKPILNKSSNESTNIDITKLWNANFILNDDIILDRKNLPFDII